MDLEYNFNFYGNTINSILSKGKMELYSYSGTPLLINSRKCFGEQDVVKEFHLEYIWNENSHSL